MFIDPSTDPYDYTRFTCRTDPGAQPARIDIADLGGIDTRAAYAGGFAAELPVIAGIWRQLSPGDATTTAMLRTVASFVEAAEDAGHTRFRDVTPSTLARFIRGECDDPAGVWPLRKNAVHGAYLALRDAGLTEHSLVVGFDAAPASAGNAPAGTSTGTRRKTYANRVHSRAAFNDEVLITRLASRLAVTIRVRHLPAATLAALCASATTSEAAQLLWEHMRPADAPTSVCLVGRVDGHGRTELDIASRVVDLDDWQQQAFAAWLRENASQRPIAPTTPVLYGGRQATTSNSAQVGVDNQLGKALTIADLDDQVGLTANSFRLWAAARNVTNLPTLEAGAVLAGVAPLTLHRQIHQLGERKLLLAS